ncbi:MAG: serine hydrolase [Rhodococcus sp. (in: high G+C Gram-positive bacteria)]|uniref:serine hydrolase n=1 Tax=Rhodococcus sp. TaxID=1831 RepID=UPI003BB68DDA
MTTRMPTVTALAALVIASSACGAEHDAQESAPACTEPGPPDVTTPDGWLGYLAAHPDTTSYLIDDGRGTRIDHDADTDRSLASAVKVVHLAAYARAVAQGTMDPNEQVAVEEWERWYLPGTDGGAHEAAVARLGGGPTVTLDGIVSAMIQESDNAAPDYLRARLGDDALGEAATAGGWTDFEPPTLLGSFVIALDPESAGSDPWEVARRYADDPAFRDTIRASVTPDNPAFTEPALLEQIRTTGGLGSAADLTAVHRSISDGSFGAGADIARNHLEWQPAPDIPDVAGIGFKGGALPAVVTDALTVRFDDGTIASGVLLVSGMSDEDHAAALATYAWQPLIIGALTDPEIADTLACLP